MNKEEIMRLIRENWHEIERYGVKKIGIFGSFSRGDAGEKSDIDLVVEFLPDMGTFRNFGKLTEFLENLFVRPVDILTPTGVESIDIDEIKDRIKREVVYVH